VVAVAGSTFRGTRTEMEAQLVCVVRGRGGLRPPGRHVWDATLDGWSWRSIPVGGGPVPTRTQRARTAGAGGKERYTVQYGTHESWHGSLHLQDKAVSPSRPAFLLCDPPRLTFRAGPLTKRSTCLKFTLFTTVFDPTI
jgi:hypothetical protein